MGLYIYKFVLQIDLELSIMGYCKLAAPIENQFAAETFKCCLDPSLTLSFFDLPFFFLVFRELDHLLYKFIFSELCVSFAEIMEVPDFLA